MQEVIAKGDRFVVERHGEPVAAVVPIDVCRQWKQGRDASFEQLRRAQDQANLEPEEADLLASEAVRAVRESR